MKEQKEKRQLQRLIAVRPETHERIRKMAYEQHKSMAAVVNELVAEKVGK